MKNKHIMVNVILVTFTVVFVSYTFGKRGYDLMDMAAFGVIGAYVTVLLTYLLRDK